MPDQSFTTVVTGAGLATVTIVPPRRLTWIVSQVTNEMLTAPGSAVCAVRKNGRLVSPLVAQADAAAGDPTVVVLPSDVLTVEWSGCTPGDVGQVFVFYEERA